MPALATTTSDRQRGHPYRGRRALAVVEDELPTLLVVDERHRLWTPSVRDIATRRQKSPGTIHGHVNRLRAARVLVHDAAGRELVDTHRLAELQGLDPAATTGGPAPADPPPPSSGPSRRVTRPDDADGGGPPSSPRLPEPADALLAAIDALTTVIELRPDLATDVASTIARLADVLAADADPDGVVVSLAAKRRAAARPARSEEARDRASDQEKESELDLPSTDQQGPTPSDQVDSPSLTHSPGARPSPIDKARARLPKPRGARSDQARTDDERPGARSHERLLELLAPLDPHRTVTRIEGVVAALARYSDEQVTHAVARVASLKGIDNGVGLLIDRANANDPTYFCANPPSPPDKDEHWPPEYGSHHSDAGMTGAVGVTGAVGDAEGLARITNYPEHDAIRDLTARYGHEPERLLRPALARYQELRARISTTNDVDPRDEPPAGDAPPAVDPAGAVLEQSFTDIEMERTFGIQRPSSQGPQQLRHAVEELTGSELDVDELPPAAWPSLGGPTDAPDSRASP